MSPPNLYIHLSTEMGEYMCVSAPYIGYNVYFCNAYIHTDSHIWVCGMYTYRDANMKYIIAICEHTLCICTDMGPHTFPFLHTLHLCIDSHIFIYSPVELGNVCRGTDMNKTNTFYL